MIPEYIKIHRPKGTEIHYKDGHYYVIKVKAYYDKVTKKSRRKAYGNIGQIYKDIGFVPYENNNVEANLITVEYGATFLIKSLSQDIFDKLKDIFSFDSIRIYVMAVLKLLNNLSIKELDDAYTQSAISLLLPEVHLSKNTVSDFLSKLASFRPQMLKFMREYSDCSNSSIIFDGSSFISSSQTNAFVEKGYNPNNKRKKQIRLIYGYNNTTKLPIYFLVAPGNISDRSVFEQAIDEINAKDCTIILDKGFFSSYNIELMTELNYIIPLQSNTKLVNKEMKLFDYRRNVISNYFFYNSRLINYVEIPTTKFKNSRIIVYYDYARNLSLTDAYFQKNNLK